MRLWPGPQRGFTLIEMVVVLAIASILALVLGAMFQGASTSMDVLAVSQRVDWDLKRVLAELSRDLKRASVATIAVDSSDPTADSVRLQVPNSDVLSGVIAWGYPNAAGAFQSGWFAEYRVVGTTLVRQHLDASVTQQGVDQVLCRDVDLTLTSAGPEKGFNVALSGELIVLSVLVRETTQNGLPFTRREETTVHLMNP